MFRAALCQEKDERHGYEVRARRANERTKSLRVIRTAMEKEQAAAERVQVPAVMDGAAVPGPLRQLASAAVVRDTDLLFLIWQET